MEGVSGGATCPSSKVALWVASELLKFMFEGGGYTRREELTHTTHEGNGLVGFCYGVVASSRFLEHHGGGDLPLLRVVLKVEGGMEQGA